MRFSLLAVAVFCLSFVSQELRADSYVLNVPTHGTLQDVVLDAVWDNPDAVITEMKITGEIDGKDLKLINESAGHFANVKKYDFSEVKIIPTKDNYAYGTNPDFMYGFYYYYHFSDEEYITTNEENYGSQGGTATHYYSNDLGMLFKGNTTIEEVILPAQCKNFGASIFEGCTALRTVVTPSGFEWKKVGDNAFKNCQNLVISIPSTVERFGKYAFYDCRSALTTEDFVLTNVKEIGNFAFYNHFFKTITITSPDLETIGGAAFRKPNDSYYKPETPLTSVDLSQCSSLKSIESYAFCDNKNLVSVILPDCLEKEGGAFYGCHGNLSINIPESLIELAGATGYNKTQIGDYILVGNILVGYIGSDTELVIPEGVISIIDGFFGYYDSNLKMQITKVTLPASLKFLGTAFNQCQALKVVEFAENSQLEEIRNNAFGYCDALETIELPLSLRILGSEVFRSCNSLTKLTIPENVDSIRGTPFEYCNNLAQINYNAKYIYKTSPFYHCDKIGTIIFGDKVERVPANLCQYMTNLTDVRLSSSVKEIGESAFYCCSKITSRMFKDTNIEKIEHLAFRSCTSLTSLPDNIKHIGESAFWYCSGLTNVPKDAEIIEHGAFADCTALESVTLTKVKSLDWVFGGCTNLKYVFLPETLETLIMANQLEELHFPSLELWCGIDFFYDGSSSFTGNPLQNVNKFFVNGEQLEGELVIPDGVRSISSDAFYGANFITSIKFPKSLTSIGNRAFAKMQN